MNKSSPQARFVFQSLVITIGAVLFLISTTLALPGEYRFDILILSAIFIALLKLFPLKFFIEIDLAFVVGFLSSMLFGPAPAGWGIIIGFVVSGLVQFFRSFPGDKDGKTWEFWLEIAFSTGLLLLPLTLTLIVFDLNGISPILPETVSWRELFPPYLFFTLVYVGLNLFWLWLCNSLFLRWQDWLIYFAIILLPFPFLLLTALTSPGQRIIAWVLESLILTLTALIMYSLGTSRRQLDRRLLELSTLNQISKTLNASLDLENLLNAIHNQLTQFLNVNNFYVALYDSSDQQIWYPLAVKHGQRQHWPRRSFTDRLTDRVILRSQPLLLPHHARNELARIGLPVGEEAPYAWIGVPLISSNITIGCLALFSLNSSVEFTQADLDLLSILSGQTSVAIEIALHNALLFSDVRIGRDRLAAVLNSVDEGIAFLEINGHVTLVNEGLAHIVGWPQSEFIGKPFSSYPPEIQAHFGYTKESAQGLLNRLSEGGSEGLAKFTFSLDSPPPEKYFERSVVPVPTQEDNLGGWLIILRDVTEQNQLQKTRDLISETLVHDLRSPVSAVLGALDVVNDLITNNQSPELAQQSISIARRSAQRVLGMVESMLEIARLQSGKVELNLMPVHLHSLIAHSISEIAPLARQYKISLHNQVPPDLPNIFIDHNKINRVISNLLDNALKFTPDQGTVTLTAGLLGKNLVVVRVSDTGPGIPGEYWEKIFERFNQVPEQRGRRRGSGLGLTFCKLAVEAHGGKIWVEANQPQGSVFIFTLPINNPEQANSSN